MTRLLVGTSIRGRVVRIALLWALLVLVAATAGLNAIGRLPAPLADLAEEYALVGAALSFSGPVATALGILLTGCSLVVLGGINRSLAHITATLRMMALGRLDAPVSVPDVTELGQLAMFANELADDLRETKLRLGGALTQHSDNEARIGEAYAKLDEREIRFRTLVQHGSDLILILGAQGEIRYASESASRICGRAPQDLLLTDVNAIVHPDDAQLLHEAITSSLESSGLSTNVDVRVRHLDGTWQHLACVIRNLTDQPTIGGLVLNGRDVTERKILEDELARQAFYDGLTGLANRALLMDRLRHMLASADRVGNPGSAIFLDIDRFKVVNDSLGHDAGDQLLVAIGERLISVGRLGDTVARLGGDEFVVLLENSDEEDARVVAERIIRVFEKDVQIDGRAVFVTLSAGVAVTTSPYLTPEDLLRNADVGSTKRRR